MASDNGIPAQWLADVVAFESGFDASAWNRGGAPAVGLIQFYADRGTGGKFGTKRIGGTTYRLQDIAQMPAVQQLDLVDAYLREVRPQGGYQNPYEVLAGIFGGPGLLNDLRSDARRSAAIGDGDISFGGYMRRLGEHAGREYEPIF